jgi:hypothetical protein
LDRCPPNSITNTFFTRANIQASTNNIIQSSFEFGQQVALGRKTGLKFALGVNLVDGFSVSQDSIQIHNGVLIEKVTTNKDLDYVINSQLGFEYVYAFDNFKFSLGPRFSYAIANKVNEDCVKELNFFNFTETSMDNSILSNYWNGINRFGIEGKLEASYQFKKFEIGLNISKRLNKLIKNNEAVSRKSNKPILFGASLSYNLN